MKTEARNRIGKILVVGSGAREHALSWKLSQSAGGPRVDCAPGNAGTSAFGDNLPIAADDIAGIARAAMSGRYDLVVVGPEAPLAAGLADEIAACARAAGLRVPCYGPGAAAARIESSKAFSKDLMRELGIPTADFRVFVGAAAAREFCAGAPWPFVIKASGLAGGKGVFLPDSADEANAVIDGLMTDLRLGEAGNLLVIEERLAGPEISVMAFCDGARYSLMPLSRDHKRLGEGDSGPNTGGMGAIAPVTDSGQDPAALGAAFIAPVLEGLRARGAPFIGTLYAGLILTADGPKALEYNCRFGDPETEAVLPLFDGDLAAVLASCAEGSLDESRIAWSRGACAAVVMASPGYPEKPESGIALRDLNPPSGDSATFHGATKPKGNDVVSAGGRVLVAMGSGPDAGTALDRAYGRAARIDFPGARYRRDIGAASHPKPFAPGSVGPGGRGKADAYARSGVDIAAGDRAVELMSAAVRSTYGPRVLAGIGSFGGLYDAAFLRGMRNPVLASSTDGVGTKVKLAAAYDRMESLGMDIVNHCIDDILVQGARPLFFLDYFAASKLDPSRTARIVSGMAEACRAAGCALIGGETAEMPGVYEKGEFDVAGTIVGVMERDAILPAGNMRPGDLLVGLASDSPHTNGFSLIRNTFGPRDYEAEIPGTGKRLIDLLLAPHRSYLPALREALDADPPVVKALAHITGGGFIGNIPRILPSGLDAVLGRGSWPVPALYDLIARKSGADPDEMHRVFNMGIGMVAVVAAADLERFRDIVKEEVNVIGELVPGSGGARFA